MTRLRSGSWRRQRQRSRLHPIDRCIHPLPRRVGRHSGIARARQNCCRVGASSAKSDYFHCFRASRHWMWLRTWGSVPIRDRRQTCDRNARLDLIVFHTIVFHTCTVFIQPVVSEYSHMRVTAGTGGLKLDSIIVCEQVRAIRKTRLANGGREVRQNGDDRVLRLL
jgi:mRNA-degrading endonuclease toxin of MazEF toxin-antitoxin module